MQMLDRFFVWRFPYINKPIILLPPYFGIIYPIKNGAGDAPVFCCKMVIA